jgi:hypothetical protein
MDENKHKHYKTTMEALAYVALICGSCIAWSAMVGWNNGSISYALYASSQAVFFVGVAMVLSIMRATKRR